MYKDKDKQRAANRLAKRRQRANQGMTKGMTYIEPVIPVDIDVFTEQPVLCNAKLTSRIEATATSPPIIKQQSYNPMMIGYVPKRGGLV